MGETQRGLDDGVAQRWKTVLHARRPRAKSDAPHHHGGGRSRRQRRAGDRHGRISRVSTLRSDEQHHRVASQVSASGKRRSRETEGPTAPAVSPRRRRAWRIAGVAVALIYIVIATQYAWREASFRQRLRTALPAPPDLSGSPTVLIDRISSAQSQANSWRGARVGVVELGRLYHANGFFAQAEACWRFFHAEEPKEARWAYYLADVRRAAGDYSAVKRLLRETVRLAPKYAPAALQLAAVEFKSGELDEAGAWYTRSVALVHDNPHGWFGL